MIEEIAAVFTELDAQDQDILRAIYGFGDDLLSEEAMRLRDLIDEIPEEERAGIFGSQPVPQSVEEDVILDEELPMV